MPIQDFDIYTKNGYAGDLVDSGPRVVQSGVVETPAGIGFGLGVKRGTANKQVLLGGEASIFAISQREYNQEADTRPSDGSTSYKVTNSISLIRQGYLYVELSGAAGVSDGDKIRVDTVTGKFTMDAVAGNVIQTTNVTSDEDGVAGDIIKIRIDIE